jgi:hypothetical protein
MNEEEFTTRVLLIRILFGGYAGGAGVFIPNLPDLIQASLDLLRADLEALMEWSQGGDA